MPTGRASAIAHHVEAAKRLLRELEEHADAARDALGADGASFLASVDDRDRLLSELNQVVEAISQEGSTDDGTRHESARLFAEMAQAAARALRAQEQLVARTSQERDRLANMLHQTNRPDRVANRYAVADGPIHSRALSVTG